MSERIGEDVTVFDFIELLRASDWVTSPTYAGWLQKKSTGWLLNSIFPKFSWQSKWVALHGLELIYADEEPTGSNVDSINVRRARITSSTKIMQDDEESKDPLAFCIQPDCLKPIIWQFRAESEEEKSNWLIKISQVHAIATWLDSYDKVRVLGVGAQGTVFEMVHRDSGERFAIKEISIESDRQMQMAISEAKLLKEITKSVAHPNIMQIEKVFQIIDKFYLVFPLCTGGELYEAVVRRGHFTERKAALILRDTISALKALHDCDILHLDIKPENILFESNHADSIVKITDFGLSKIFSEGVHNQTKNCPSVEELNARAEAFINCGNFNADHVRGTFGYMSPELILCGYYSTASDVFASGVILYILLCGYPPFNSKSIRQLFLRTVKGAYKLSGPEWDRISPEAKDLIKKMLDTNPRTRISTEAVLVHPWIVKAVEAHDKENATAAATAAAAAAAAKTGTAGPSPPRDEAPTMLLSTTRAHLTAGLHGQSSVLPNTRILLSQLGGDGGDGGDGDTGSTKSNSSQSSNVSLTNALDHLADHIKVLKTEKLAKRFARLLLAKKTQAGSRLAAVYLIPRNKVGKKPSMEFLNGKSAKSMSPILEDEEAFDDSSNHSSKVDATNTTRGNSSTANTQALSLALPVATTTTTSTTATSSSSKTNTSAISPLTPAEERENAISTKSSTSLDGASNGPPPLLRSNTASTNIASSTKTVASELSTGTRQDEELLQMINSEVKEIATAALFAYFGAGEDGKLSTKQCIAMLKTLGLTGVIPTRNSNNGQGSPSTNDAAGASAGANSSIAGAGIVGALIAKFMDQDSKGYVTADDFFTAMLLVLQRDELFLHCMFKVYQNSVWYPGRQQNYTQATREASGSDSDSSAGLPRPPVPSSSSRETLANLMENTTTTTTSTSTTTTTTSTSTSTTTTNSDNNAQGQYDQDGQEQRAQRPNPKLSVSISGSVSDGDSNKIKKSDSSERLKNLQMANEPPPMITGKHIAAVFERFGYDPIAGQKAFAILCEALARLAQERRANSMTGSITPTATPSAPTAAACAVGSSKTNASSNSSNSSCANDQDSVDNAAGGETSLIDERGNSYGGGSGGGGGHDNNIHTGSGNPSELDQLRNMPQAPAPTAAAAAAAATKKPAVVLEMSVTDFIEAAKLDEILIDVTSVEPHRKLFALFRQIELKLQSTHAEELEQYLLLPTGDTNAILAAEALRKAALVEVRSCFA